MDYYPLETSSIFLHAALNLSLICDISYYFCLSCCIFSCENILN